jgi:hypothetical protein
MIRPAAVLAITGLVLVTGVAWLREGLEHREDDLRADRATMLTVELRATGGRVTEEDARLLWLTCSRGLTREQRAADWRLSGHRMLLTIRPALGEHQQRQLVGCLEDLALDHVRAEVRSVRDVPAAADEEAAE